MSVSRYTEDGNWLKANQRVLTEAIAQVRAALQVQIDQRQQHGLSRT